MPPLDDAFVVAAAQAKRSGNRRFRLDQAANDALLVQQHEVVFHAMRSVDRLS